MTLGALIRDIRKSRGEIGHVFAALLGVRQGTLSQYENDLIMPSAAILLRVHELAQTPHQRAGIREALGPAGAQLRAPAETARDREVAAMLKRFEIDSDAGSATRQRFEELCVQILHTGDIPLWLMAAMELWLETRTDIVARRKFEETFNTQVRAMKTLSEVSKILRRGR